MAASVYSGNVPAAFDKNIKALWTQRLKSKTPVWKGYLEEQSTTLREVAMSEWVGDGLWSVTEEGNDIDMGQIGQGFITRARPKKFARRLVIPEEAMEDAIHDEAFKATEVLADSLILSEEYDAVGILDNTANASFVGGDGVVLSSTAHPLKGGGTYSTQITATTPSNTGVQLMLIAAEKMPGSNGFIAGVSLESIVCPVDKKFRFREILKSEKRDDTANNAINAIKGELKSDPVAVRYMASTTNWFGKTDARDGGIFMWRRKPRYRSANFEINESVLYTGSARWVTFFNNPRFLINSLA